jgi:thiamine biosynthesis lipoprotein
MNPSKTSIISLLSFGLSMTFCTISNVIADSTSYHDLSYKIHYEDVLGTSMDVDIYGVEKLRADSALSKTLKEVQRLENILSTWKKTSQITQLNIAGKGEGISNELIQVISECEKWRSVSNKKFSCRMGKIKQLWLDAEKQQQVPDRIKVRYKAREIRGANLTIDINNNTVELEQSITLDLAGLAKGFIIDSASTYLRQLLPNATGIKLDIGGDAFYWGKPVSGEHWKVLVAEPIFINDTSNINDSRLSKGEQNNPQVINLQSMAIASSGHISRYREIERRKFSHILDPIDGWPMNDAPSATVIAPDAVTADAVATALSTQAVAQGIDWVNQLDNVEALIMLPNGLKIASKGWHTYLDINNFQSSHQKIFPLTDLKNGNEKLVKLDRVSNGRIETDIKSTRARLLIEYQIPLLQESKKYHKPYVAIWISDRNNKSVRNLLLLGESNRWAKENTRWWRRVGRKDRSLIDGIARPTRRPGQYKLYWDGLDDFGKFDLSGHYFLNVEAAREGGGHDYQRIEFDFGSSINANNIWQPIQRSTKGEVGTVTLIYTTEVLLASTSKRTAIKKQITQSRTL